jgi:Fic-DOC domain mobile mystery protein B
VVTPAVSVFDGPPGSTPLEPGEQDDLIPTWIASRGDLNSAEQENIARGVAWVRRFSWKPSDITQAWLKDLHRRMFADVWRWAGVYRSHDTNVGGPWLQIPVALEDLVRDMLAQIGGAWSSDEVAVRFHHRLVSIHLFPNGNGRHARLAADVLVEALGEKRFGWGVGTTLVDAGEARSEYLAALRTADQEGDYRRLLRFARS